MILHLRRIEKYHLKILVTLLTQWNLFLTVEGIAEVYTPGYAPVGEPCTVGNSRRLPGVCTNLKDCPIAIGAIRSGIMPTKCSVSSCETNQSTNMDLGYNFFFKCSNGMYVVCDKYSSIIEDKSKKTKKGDEDFQCPPDTVDTYISGGQNAQPGHYNHQAALGYNVTSPNDLMWKCGGTLISTDFVLTAAHCIAGSTVGPPTKVFLGDINLPGSNAKLGKFAAEIPIAEIILHPNYFAPLVYNDIALIRLANPVNISKQIMPACLPQAEFRLDKHASVEATGWGQTGAFDKTSQILQYVWLDRFSDADCNKFFNTLPDKNSRFPEGVIRKQFCAGDSTDIRDTCRGDSGGPITVHKDGVYCIFYVLGVTSFGSSLCGYQQPGVYTNVQSYLDWIEDVVWPKSLYYNNKTFEYIMDVNKTSTFTGTFVQTSDDSKGGSSILVVIKETTTTAAPTTTTTTVPTLNVTAAQTATKNITPVPTTESPTTKTTTTKNFTPVPTTQSTTTKNVTPVPTTQSTTTKNITPVPTTKAPISQTTTTKNITPVPTTKAPISQTTTTKNITPVPTTKAPISQTTTTKNITPASTKPYPTVGTGGTPRTKAPIKYKYNPIPKTTTEKYEDELSEYYKYDYSDSETPMEHHHEGGLHDFSHRVKQLVQSLKHKYWDNDE